MSKLSNEKDRPKKVGKFKVARDKSMSLIHKKGELERKQRKEYRKQGSNILAGDSISVSQTSK